MMLIAERTFLREYTREQGCERDTEAMTSLIISYVPPAALIQMIAFKDSGVSVLLQVTDNQSSTYTTRPCQISCKYLRGEQKGEHGGAELRPHTAFTLLDRSPFNVSNGLLRCKICKV